MGRFENFKVRFRYVPSLQSGNSQLTIMAVKKEAEY